MKSVTSRDNFARYSISRHSEKQPGYIILVAHLHNVLIGRAGATGAIFARNSSRVRYADFTGIALRAGRSSYGELTSEREERRATLQAPCCLPTTPRSWSG